MTAIAAFLSYVSTLRVSFVTFPLRLPLFFVFLLTGFFASAQWLSGYDYRKEITLDGGDIAGNLTGFPVLISFASDAGLAANVQDANGYDIAFADSDGTTVLPHNLESYNSGTGALEIWVKVDLTASTDKDIYLYYGNSSISADQSSTDTWDSDFIGIWHLDSDYEDASAYNHDITYNGTTNATGSIFGDGEAFDKGSLQHIEVGADSDFDLVTDLTISFWMKPGDIDDWARLVVRNMDDDSGGPHTNYGVFFTGGGGPNRSLMFQMEHSGGGTSFLNSVTTVPENDGNWYHVVATYDGAYARIYINGTEANNDAETRALYTPPTAEPFVFGRRQHSGVSRWNYYDGDMDEVRLSKVARSAQWIATEYANQNDPAGFLKTLGAEVSACAVVTGVLNADHTEIASGGNTNISVYGYESGATLQWQSSTDNTNFANISGGTTSMINTGNISQTTYYRVVVTQGCANTSSSLAVTVGGSSFANGYAFRKKITFAGADISGSHTNFPMLIRTTSDAQLLAGVTDANGYDIVFTDGDGTTSLFHDLEHYDNTTGGLVAWVNVDLTDGADKEIYMYYGNSSVTTDQSSEDTWSSDFAGVWHLHDDLLDATDNNNDGTNQGSSDIAGIIGDAQDFEHDDPNDGIDLPNMDVTGNYVTLSAWINLESNNAADPRIISKADGCCTNDHIWKMGIDKDGVDYKLRSRMKASNSPKEDISNNVLPFGTWLYVQTVFDGSAVKHYINGAETLSNAHAGTVINKDGTVPVSIGQDPDGNDNNFDGQIDEVRVLNVVRSEDWLLTEYNNQRDGSTSLTFGTEEGGCSVNTGTLVALDDRIDSGESTVITLSGYDPGSTFQWQESNNNVDFTNIALATSDTLVTASLTASKFYRVMVTSCGAEPSSSIWIDVAGDYLAGYNYRKKIIFKGTEIVDSHTEFPLLVRLDADADLADGVQNSNGFDIVFTEADGTSVLSHELEFFDSSTGQLAAWVKTSVTDDTNKEIYMYYGNAAILSDQSLANTWNSSYGGVWHLGDDYDDGTSNNNDAYLYTSSNTSGIIGDADDFDGAGAGVYIADNTSLDLTTSFTLSVWFNPEDISGDEWERILTKSVLPAASPWNLYSLLVNGTTDQLRYQVVQSGVGSNNNSTTVLSESGGWYYGVLTYDGTQLKLYVNGSEEQSDAYTGSIDTNNVDLTIGRPAWNANYFDGQIDEARVSNTAKSGGWIQTEYYNQRLGSSMMLLGAEEWTCDLSPTGSVSSARSSVQSGETAALLLTNYNPAADLQWQTSADGVSFSDAGGATNAAYTSAALTTDTYFRVELSNGACDAYSDTLLVPIRYDFIDGYSYRMKLTIPAANVSGTDPLVDFPLLVDITNDSIKSEANGGHVVNDNGYEFKFTTLAGSDLNYERETYDEVNGQLRAWVKIPSLSATANTEIFLYYGNCTALSDPNSTDTWANAYRAVWHMDEVNPVDATANGFNLTNQGTANNTSAQIGSGRAFTRSESDYLDLPGTNNLINGVSQVTMSAWINTSDRNDAQVIFGTSINGSANSRASMEIITGSEAINVGGRADDTNAFRSVQETTGSIQNNDQWYYVAGVIDYSTGFIYIYVDGVLTESGLRSFNATATSGTNSTHAAIGSEDNGGNNFFGGSIDEVRVSNTSRSANWIKTEYDNQLNPGTFLTVATEEVEFQWTGTFDTNWATNGNWSSCELPTETTPVRIPDVSNDPVLSGTATMCDLTIESGAVLDLGTSNTTICGNILNEGVLNGNTSTLLFSGSENQSYTGNSATLNNLTMNKTGGAELLLFNELRVDGTLTLSAGNINLVEGDLSVTKGVLAGGSPDTYVVTGGSACLRQKVENAEVFFPVGAVAGSFSPAVLNNAGVADTFCIRVIDHIFADGSESGTPLSEGVVGKTWFIEEELTGGSNVTLTLRWRNADQQSSFTRNNAQITHYNAGLSSWEMKTSGTVAALGAGRFGVSAVGINDFSPFGVGSLDGPLPVELISFYAQHLGEAVRLQWSTATEIDNDYFSIERGLDSESFETLANVPGQGDSDVQVDYEYVDPQPLPGHSYYRLKQTDYDGTFTYSNVVIVKDEVVRTPDLAIYPNANDGFDFNWTLEGLIPNSEVMITLYDVQGNLLVEQALWLDASGTYVGKGFQDLYLESGMYLLKATNNGKDLVRRLIVE
ncbi:MAG: DUF2341 domain-containing protein [Bacteroidota bacterium]